MSSFFFELTICNILTLELIVIKYMINLAPKAVITLGAFLIFGIILTISQFDKPANAQQNSGRRTLRCQYLGT
jgi:hypothetical protein